MSDEMDRVVELAAQMLAKNAHYQGVVADRAAKEVALVLLKDESLHERVIEAVVQNGVNGAQQKLEDMGKKSVERMVSQNIGPIVAKLTNKLTARLLADEEPQFMLKDKDTDWVSAPGESLHDLLEERGVVEMDRVEFLSRATAMGSAYLAGVLSGSEGYAVNREFAEGLERMGCGTKEFWLRREALYRAKLAGLELK